MFDVVFATCGVVLVVLVWMSVLRTTLIPGRSSSRTARWAVRICSATATALARAMPFRTGTRAVDLCGSVSLFLIAASWLAGLTAGFAMIGMALGDIRPGPSFVLEMNGAVIALVVTASASTVLVAAAFAAYLIRFMEAYDRREAMIARSVAHMQRVTDADALVANYLRSGSRDSLDNYFAQWAGWLADVHLSHVSFPGLVYHRSAGDLDWPKAAVVVMDAAALVEAVAPRWAPLHAQVLLDVGSRCLQCLAAQIGIVLPPITVSLQGREERGFCDTMELALNSGLPAEQNIDNAWKDFQRIRVRYAPYAILISTRLANPRITENSY